MRNIKQKKITDLTPDDRNFNKGTPFGEHLMDESLRKFGLGRSILLDKNDRIIAGNKTYQKAGELGFENVLVVETDGNTLVAVKRTDVDLDSTKGRELALADNATGKANLAWDEDTLMQCVEEFDFDPEDWGVKYSQENTVWDEPTSEQEENPEESAPPQDEDFEINDILYESNNKYEIPTLLLDMQAGKVELPLTPWGANSRLKKDVSTYHFYVDDYRFEKLFKDPINLLSSGCRSIVEPNCSLHDQTPIAYGIHLIYKKRWLARYCQDCGIKVFADLNVSHKFREYNMLGIPKGYNAFFTRGTDGWLESLKIDLETAREISGKENPNLVVYGGGKETKEFCQEHNLLYITDFINAKKIVRNGKE